MVEWPDPDRIGPFGGWRRNPPPPSMGPATGCVAGARLPGNVMLDRLRARFDYETLPIRLRWYVIAVSLIGPAVAALFWSVAQVHFGPRDWLLAALLGALTTLAERYPLHLTHKTSVNVGTAIYLAMLLLLPWQTAPLIAFVGAASGQIWRMKSNPTLNLPDPGFNAGQVALYVSACALAAHGVNGALARTSAPTELRAVVVLIVASAVLHVVNTGLVAIAAALQMGVAPFRVWSHNLALDLLPHLTLTVLGGMAARLADASPLFLAAMVVPGVLIHRAVSQTVRLRADTHDALAALVEVVELRDPYTAGHSRRVATSARSIALAMGLTAEEADLIESAGRVHDIGKIAIDPAILSKTDRLADAEWIEMKQHPVLGANVVERFAAYRDGAALVRHHHEAWDGSGYPDGLAGEAIPLGARVLAVADTFDALTSDRPYRAGMSVARAVAILEAGASRQWDARAVTALLDQLAQSPAAVPLHHRPEPDLAEAPLTVPAAV